MNNVTVVNCAKCDKSITGSHSTSQCELAYKNQWFYDDREETYLCTDCNKHRLEIARSYKIGDKIKLRKTLESHTSIIDAGKIVIITEIDPDKGYTVENIERLNEYPPTVSKCGFDIGEKVEFNQSCNNCMGCEAYRLKGDGEFKKDITFCWSLNGEKVEV